MCADDITLLAVHPSGLQQLINNLVSFCTCTGLAISLTKTNVMQFVPCRTSERHVPWHTFSLGSATLDNVDSYKYLGVHFRSTRNPSHYMVAARDQIGGAYHVMRLVLWGQCPFAVFFLRCHCRAVTLAPEQSERELPKSIVNICVASKVVAWHVHVFSFTRV
jgi:hypothetical protein